MDTNNVNYQTIYNSLIERSKGRAPVMGFSYERHHIIPKCLGGSNSKNNIAILTPEEHYVAHQLLVKIYPDDRKLIKAANRMTTGKHRNNKLYGWLRRRHTESMIGEKNSFYGKAHTEETRRKISEKGRGRVMSSETKQRLSVSKTGIPRSEELKSKVSNSKKNSELTPKTKISTPHGIFNSIIECSIYLDRHSATIISKLNSNKHPDWYRI